MTGTALIGIDWGTTSLRAYRMDRAGAVLDTHDARAGILQVEGGDFEDAFERELGPWLENEPKDLPVVASGMITSRQGWHETPYLPCPGDAADLARALTPRRSASGHWVWFVTGLEHIDPSGVPDVMRGEETQIVGCLADGDDDGLFVLPGTHSKWALVKDGRIVRFATFMTGELFQALRDHTILGRLMAGDDPAPGAFRKGVGYGLLEEAEAGGLLRRLFSARTHGLFDNIEADGLSDYLSGLLIGAELREALGSLADRACSEEIRLVGRGALVARYEQALGLAGRRTRRAAQDAAARGHYLIASAAGLIS